MLCTLAHGTSICLLTYEKLKGAACKSCSCYTLSVFWGVLVWFKNLITLLLLYLLSVIDWDMGFVNASYNDHVIHLRLMAITQVLMCDNWTVLSMCMKYKNVRPPFFGVKLSFNLVIWNIKLLVRCFNLIFFWENSSLKLFPDFIKSLKLLVGRRLMLKFFINYLIFQ